MSGFHSRRAEMYKLAMACCPDARRAELEPFGERLPTVGDRLFIADIACGDGYLTKYLAREFPQHRATGIETSQELLVTLQQSGLAEYLHVRNLAALPLQSARFDCAVSLASMHHVTHKKRVFAEAARILRPGGRFVIGDVCDDTSTQAFFDDVSSAHCICGHDFDFLDGPLVGLLGGKTGLRLESSTVIDTPWVFASEKRALAFVRDLLGLEVPLDVLARKLAAHFTIDARADAFVIEWQLGYHVLVKEG